MLDFPIPDIEPLSHNETTFSGKKAPEHFEQSYDFSLSGTSANHRLVSMLAQRYARQQTTIQSVYVTSEPDLVPVAIDGEGTSIPDLLQGIKKNLGLNLSQLSKIIGVSRPQLNRWLEGEVLPQNADTNRRITILSGLIGELPEGHGKYFGKLAKRYVSADQSLLEAMSNLDLNREHFLSLYGAISADIKMLERKAEQPSNFKTPDVLLPPAL